MKTTDTNEVWIPIPNYEGLYEISNIGRVKCLAKEVFRKNYGVRKYPEIIMKVRKSQWVYLYKDKKKELLSVKKLYLLIFKGINIVKDKYKNTTIIDGIPCYTSQRRIAQIGKLNMPTKQCKLVGVSFCTTKGKPYRSQITINKTNIHLGRFYTEEEANKMYIKADKYSYLYKGHAKTFRELLLQVVE